MSCTLDLALRVKPEWETSGYNPVELLDPDTLPSRLAVRNWRPGDRFWPAHTKSPKKIKELLQERQIPALDRAVVIRYLQPGRRV